MGTAGLAYSYHRLRPKVVMVSLRLSHVSIDAMLWSVSCKGEMLGDLLRH